MKFRNAELLTQRALTSAEFSFPQGPGCFLARPIPEIPPLPEAFAPQVLASREDIRKALESSPETMDLDQVTAHVWEVLNRG
jgi:hypothetical protein